MKKRGFLAFLLAFVMLFGTLSDSTLLTAYADSSDGTFSESQTVDTSVYSWDATEGDYGEYNGTSGYFSTIYVDATSGKFVDRGSDFQVNAGTVLYIPVAANATLTLKCYSEGLTIMADDTEMTADGKYYSYTNGSTDQYVKVVFNSSNYLYTITAMVAGDYSYYLDYDDVATSWDFTDNATVLANNNNAQVYFQGTTGSYQGLYIDATSGKFQSRDQGDVQVNDGTIIVVPLTGAATVTVNYYVSRLFRGNGG